MHNVPTMPTAEQHAEVIREMRAADANYRRLRDAIENYARLHPLDLKDARTIKADPHMHQASIGSDACNLCGHDLQEFRVRYSFGKEGE